VYFHQVLELHYPIHEPEGTAILFEYDPTHTEGEMEAQLLERAHPARLRQNINPPLRFGDFVSHKKQGGDDVAMTYIRHTSFRFSNFK